MSNCSPSLDVMRSPSLVLVLLWLPEALAVQCFPCHLHHGLNLWIHVKDAFLALPLLTLRHETQLSSHCFFSNYTEWSNEFI